LPVDLCLFFIFANTVFDMFGDVIDDLYLLGSWSIQKYTYTEIRVTMMILYYARNDSFSASLLHGICVICVCLSYMPNVQLTERAHYNMSLERTIHRYYIIRRKSQTRDVIYLIEPKPLKYFMYIIRINLREIDNNRGEHGFLSFTIWTIHKIWPLWERKRARGSFIQQNTKYIIIII